MRMLELMKVLSVQRQRHVWTTHGGCTSSASQIIADGGCTSSAPQIKCSPSQQGDDSQCAEAMGSQVQLPEDILHQIHALMPMRDAARAACVSRGFLRSWRCYPKIILNVDTLGINEDASQDEITRDFISIVDQIVQNHAGMGLRAFKLATYPCSSLHPSYVDRWLQAAIVPGIKEFALQMAQDGEIKYNFPCSLVSSEKGISIQSFFLAECSFHPEVQLNFLYVISCKMLEVIESNAPKLSSFSYVGRPIPISLGDSMQVRKVRMVCNYESDMLYYASTKLPSIAPNIETLYLSTRDETINTPMALGKFFHLKYLEIVLFTPSCSPYYDFYSLISFLDASPALETFILRVEFPVIRHDSILEELNGDSSHPRRLSEYCHDNLRNVMITGFCSARSMIELTSHIIEKTSTLECLTLDTTRGYDRRFVKSDYCLGMSEEALAEAEKACLAIRRYVEGRVPSTVNLKVIEPCSKCHTNKR